MTARPDREVGSTRSARWANWRTRAAARVQRRLAECGELTPRELARTVAAAVPRRIGRWLLRLFVQHGWLRRDAMIPFSILDDGGGATRRCAPSAARHSGPRALLHLALFGPAGQGVPYREKHRQDVYQQVCAEIMSSAVDLVSLQASASRALNNSEVITDPVLNSMIRAFIAQREAALRHRPLSEVERERQEQASKLQHAFEYRPRSAFPTKEELVMSFGRLQREFDSFLAQFEEAAALKTLDKMRDLRQRFPVHVAAAELQRCEEQYDKLLRRAGTYRRQLREAAERAAEAAQRGDTCTSTWLIRRFQAVHRLFPNLLPADRLEVMVADIQRSGEIHETQEAARSLVQREREIAAQIKDLAGVIHRFHELSQKLPSDHNAYRRAELNYKRAVEEIRRLDTAWLTSLMLELEQLLDELDDPTGEMHTQLDQFLSRVRTALNRLCLEIRARQRRPPPDERPSAPPPTPSDGPARGDDGPPG